MVIVLDTFPASSVSKRPGKTQPTVSDQCRQWINDCEAAGHTPWYVLADEHLREVE